MKASASTSARNACLPRLALIASLLALPAPAGADLLYLSYPNDNTIQKFDLTTGADLGAFATSGLNQPTGLAADSAGNLYVANLGNATIMKFNPLGVGSTFAASGLTAPYGLALDQVGNLYAADMVGTITKYTPNGSGSVFASGLASSLFGLALDPAGNLYASAVFDQQIYKFNPQGTRLPFVMTGLTTPIEPAGLACDSAGNLYVVDAGLGSIFKFTPDGTGSFFALPLGGPQPVNGIAFDSAGSLYSANADKTIDKFTANGVGSLFANTTGQPYLLAIQTIPEPSAWAILLLGIMPLLALHRRNA